MRNMLHRSQRPCLLVKVPGNFQWYPYGTVRSTTALGVPWHRRDGRGPEVVDVAFLSQSLPTMM